jgi:nucleotide-binding universal stress UspA family protein
MKTILVPTDFSETAFGAAVYACELAKAISAKLIFFHAYHPPLPATGAEYGILPDLDLDKENLLLLENFKRDVLKKVDGSLAIECDVKIGFAADEIVVEVEEKKPDLIVMGISGGGRISEFLMGSNTSAVIRRTKIPAIIVPPKTVYKKPSSMVFTYDYKGEVSAKVIASLKNFMHLFKAQLRVLNLEKPEEGVTFEKAVNGIQLENALSTETHTLHFLPNRVDIADEINDFIDSHEADLLVMVPHRHSLLHRLFSKSITQHMAFHSHVPILALHE